MINIDKVKYGITPYGPDAGMPAFAIYLADNAEGTLGIEGLDPTVDVDKIGEIFYAKATELSEDLDKKIKDIGREDDWIEALAAPKTKEYITFIGDIITSDEYFYVINMLLQIISVKSKDLQTMIHESGKKVEVCAPKFAMVTLPNSPYIKKNIYESCNMVLAHLPVEKNGERLEFTNKDEFFHINGLTNIAKHPFGSFVLIVNKEEDFDTFKEFYEKNLLFKLRGAIRIISGNNEIKAAAQKFALENKYRYAEKLEGPDVLDFDL